MKYRFDDYLLNLLACPLCKGHLSFSSLEIRCRACDQCFPQKDEGIVDLLPRNLLHNARTDWAERQDMMERWYKDLFAASWAGTSLALDYNPYARILSSYSGVILDVGGGAGIVRRYLTACEQYIILDPSLYWRKAAPESIAERFFRLQRKPRFIRGLGEYLPFTDQVFDSVLAFWTINHVSDPKAVFREVWRVVRRGGRFLVALEDMEPTLVDLLRGTLLNFSMAGALRVLGQKCRCTVLTEPWPVANDHLRIIESDVRRWSAPYFEVGLRGWIGRYLTYEFKKLESTQSES
jgi:SAM-dependent methyltransferase